MPLSCNQWYRNEKNYFLLLCLKVFLILFVVGLFGSCTLQHKMLFAMTAIFLKHFFLILGHGQCDQMVE